MQKIISKRELVILYVTIGVILFAILFNFALAPVMVKNSRLNNDIAYARSKLSKYMRLLGQREYIEFMYKQTYMQNPDSPSQDGRLVETLTELENLAKTSDLRIIDIRPQGESRSMSTGEIIVDLKTEGSQEGFLRFVYLTENSLLLLKIKKFSLVCKPNSKVLEGNFSISQPVIPQ